MRRILLFIICCFLLTTAVSAESAVTSMDSTATLSSNGSCAMALTFQFTVDSFDGDLRFPLPGSAKDITLNGSTANTSRSDGLRWVDLADVVYGPGTYSLSIHYTLPDLVVRDSQNGLMLELPLLSGFSYPVQQLNFTVNLPGENAQIPTFQSTYYPEEMDTLVQLEVDGKKISGYFTQGMKDHETLILQLPVTSKMFPQNIAKRWSLSYDDLLQYTLLILALLYWIFFLRSPFAKRVRRVQAPDGVTAGELGCCLCGQGVDFSMMILSWAHMGYLTVEIDRHQRVLLHKTMDMDNERNSNEMRWFKTLFGRRTTVDAGCEHFARLSRKAGRVVLGSGYYFRKNSGNPLIFRCIAVGIGTISGYSLAVAFASDTVWQVVLSICLIPLGTLLSWQIQSSMRGISLRHRFSLYVGAACCVLWLILGVWAGEGAMALFVVITQILAGYAAMRGGRRTAGGMQSRNEILGLRRYLKTITDQEVARITGNNPDYFFDLLPDAMALGVDKPFARAFGNEKLSACPYLQTADEEPKTPKQWAALLRQAVQGMDERKRRSRKFFPKR